MIVDLVADVVFGTGLVLGGSIWGTTGTSVGIGLPGSRSGGLLGNTVAVWLAVDMEFVRVVLYIRCISTAR